MADPSYLQVSSKMWLSKACIVLVGGTSETVEEVVNVNLAHEYGFFQGQGKPVLLLVEKGYKDALKTWTNAAGVNAPASLQTPAPSIRTISSPSIGVFRNGSRL